jgi:hypothetical protein
MKKPMIKFGEKGSLIPHKGNFFIKGKIYDHAKADFKNWVIIWERDENYMLDVENQLYEASERVGISMDYAKKIKLPDGMRQPSHIKNAVEKAAKFKPQIIVLIADRVTQKRGYNLFKQYCRQNHGIQTQVIKLDYGHFKKRGLFDSVAKQMAAKCGWRPWLVQPPTGLPKGEVLMMIGADVYHKSGRESVASVVGTTNPSFSSYVSLSSVQPKRGQEIMDNVASMVIQAVTEFVKINKRVPSTIIFYRDGVGKGQYDLVKAIEIAKIKKELADKYLDKCPKLDFILVNKRINDRFYLDNSSTPAAKNHRKPSWGRNNHYNKPVPKVKNPDTGTMILDNCTSDTHQDFFMVAQNVT